MATASAALSSGLLRGGPARQLPTRSGYISVSSGKREQHAGERRVPGAGKAASARSRFAAFASRAAAALANDIALISARLFFSCGSRTLRRLPSSSSKDPVPISMAAGEAAAGDAAAGLELAGEDELAPAAAAAAAFRACRSLSRSARAAASLAMLLRVVFFSFFPGILSSR